MSETKTKLKRVKVEVERSRLNSKEEAKLDTPYDKILDRISGIVPSLGLNFVLQHRDYNSEKGTPKLITITNISGAPIAEFSLTDSIEYNFLNADSPRFTANLVSKDENYPLTLQRFADELGKILNVNVKIVLDSPIGKSAHRKA